MLPVGTIGTGFVSPLILSLVLSIGPSFFAGASKSKCLLGIWLFTMVLRYDLGFKGCNLPSDTGEFSEGPLFGPISDKGALSIRRELIVGCFDTA
jgi:hypothetical protein